MAEAPAKRKKKERLLVMLGCSTACCNTSADRSYCSLINICMPHISRARAGFLPAASRALAKKASAFSHCCARTAINPAVIANGSIVEDSAGAGSKETLTRETFEMHLQIGAFSDVKNADSLLRQVSKITGRKGRIRASTTNNSRLYRVQLGPLLNVVEIEHLAVRLRELGINEYYLVND